MVSVVSALGRSELKSHSNLNLALLDTQLYFPCEQGREGLGRQIDLPTEQFSHCLVIPRPKWVEKGWVP